MTKQEMEELRLQLGWSVDYFSRQVGLSALEYSRYKEPDTIEDPFVMAKVHEIELNIERENLDAYSTKLTTQPAGPFATGKILSHLPAISQLMLDPQRTAPITVEWHLSNRCNHACPFCTFRENVHASPGHAAIFPENLIGPLIEDLKALGVKAVVYSGGGEPLLYPGVVGVMRAVKKAGIRQGLITNGTKIDQAGVAQAILENCDWVRISVDAGSQEIYRKTHGPSCDFRKTIDAIEALAERRETINTNRPRIGVSFLLSMLNYKDLLPFALLFQGMGVDYFQVKPLVISVKDRLASGNIFWRKEIFDQLSALPEHYRRPPYMVYTMGFKFVDLVKTAHEKTFRKCHGHPFYPVVTATADVYVCCLMIGNENLRYGKITEDFGLKKLWFSAKRQQVGEGVDVKACPVNCKLSETNKILEQIIKKYEDPYFLN